jgi:4-amino-4-deoxy-L-arabinose transferase-like glycosyltransferase
MLRRFCVAPACLGCALSVTETRTGWPLLVAAVVSLAALQLWLRPLLPVDETRYLSVAWEMWSRGDFLVPYLNGEPYSHKPPLLFWMIHGLWGVFGVSGWPARLIPVALSLLALWWSALLAVRLWPEHGGTLGPLVPWLLFGSVFWMNFYTLVQFDLLLVLAALAAWLGVLRASESFRSGWLLVALAVGLGALSKGPVILVPVLPALLFARWWLPTGPVCGWWRWYLGGAGAVLAGAAIALLWAIPAGHAGGEAYREAIFWGQSAGRMVQSFAHRGGWWVYLLWLPLMWLPWVLWPPLWRGVGQLSRREPGVRFCLAVLVPALLVFSLISGKQGKYLLPLLPLVAGLSARALAAQDPAARLRLWPAGLLLAFTGVALTALPWWPQGLAWKSQVQLMWGPALLLCSLPFFRLRLQRVAAVRSLTLAAALATASLYAGVVDLLAPQYRLQPLATRLSELQQQGHELAWLGNYHGQFQFLGRLRRPVQALRQPGGLRGWLAAHPQGYVLVSVPDNRPDVPGDLFVQPYRSGALVLWSAQRLLQAPERLDALAGNA